MFIDSVSDSRKYDAYEERHHKTSNCSLPCFLGTKMRSEGVPSDPASHEIRRGVPHPSDDECEEQQQWPMKLYALQPNSIRQRKCHKYQSAGADSSRWQ